MYYLYYHTHHTGLTVSILLPVPPERQDKHLEPPQPISQHSPRACEQLWTMSEGNDVWPPMLFVPWNKSLIQLKECPRTSFPVFPPRQNPRLSALFFHFAQMLLLEVARVLLLIFLNFPSKTSWDYNPRKSSRQEEGRRGLLVIDVFWEVPSSSGCVWSRNKYRKSTGGRVDRYYYF